MKAAVRAAPWCAVASPVLLVLSGIVGFAALGAYDGSFGIGDSPQPLTAAQRFEGDVVAGMALGVLDLAFLAQLVAGVVVARVIESWQRAGRWPLATMISGYVAGASAVLIVVPLLFNSSVLGSVLLWLFVAALSVFLFVLSVAGRRAGLFVGGLGVFGMVTGVVIAVAAASWIIDPILWFFAAPVALVVYFIWSIWFGAELRRMWRWRPVPA